MRRLAQITSVTLLLGTFACTSEEPSEDSASTETGDGDGDPSGDGDGDPSGDGDGDPSGDGDGDPSGDGDGDPSGDGDGDPGVFTLTSPAYEHGGVIPDAHSCHGANISPALAWADAPAETLSFALFFTDLANNFDHSAIWDVSAELDGLPEDVDKQAMPANVPGAVQPESYAGWNGYAGPCPPNTHTYRWTLYALDVATLAEVDADSTLAEAEAAMEAHAIASVTLEGDFTPN